MYFGYKVSICVFSYPCFDTGDPGRFMLLVSVAWCSHVALIKFLSIAISLVIVNCENVNYCQWRHNNYQCHHVMTYNYHTQILQKSQLKSCHN